MSPPCHFSLISLFIEIYENVIDWSRDDKTLPNLQAFIVTKENHKKSQNSLFWQPEDRRPQSHPLDAMSKDECWIFNLILSLVISQGTRREGKTTSSIFRGSFSLGRFALCVIAELYFYALNNKYCEQPLTHGLQACKYLQVSQFTISQVEKSVHSDLQIVIDKCLCSFLARQNS